MSFAKLTTGRFIHDRKVIVHETTRADPSSESLTPIRLPNITGQGFEHCKCILLEENLDIIYYLLTKSAVITGKSQTEALMLYWPIDSEVNTSRPRSEISLK